MKRIIVLILALFIFCSLAACGAVDENENENVKSWNERMLNESGFEVVKLLGRLGDTSVYLIYDLQTKAEYIFIDGHESYALSPYYDKNGNVAFYKGD